VNNVDWGGPYVTAAFFCEHLLQERDNVNSAIRIIDRVFVPSGLPEGVTAPPPPVFKLFIQLKAGTAVGTHLINIRVVKPDTTSGGSQNLSLLFEGDDRSASLMLETLIPTDMQGLYWFEVRSGEALLTKLSVRVVFQQVTFAAYPQP